MRTREARRRRGGRGGEQGLEDGQDGGLGGPVVGVVVVAGCLLHVLLERDETGDPAEIAPRLAAGAVGGEEGRRRLRRGIAAGGRVGEVACVLRGGEGLAELAELEEGWAGCLLGGGAWGQ